MRRGLATVLLIALIITPIVIVGCKGRAEKEAEMPSADVTTPTEDVVISQAPVTEPAGAKDFNQETIPPTAAVPQAAQGTEGALDRLARGREIQTALTAAGFYTSNIDGKIGPKTKKAIIEFQRAKGLKTDGKVGPKTWSELEKYLVRQ